MKRRWNFNIVLKTAAVLHCFPEGKKGERQQTGENSLVLLHLGLTKNNQSYVKVAKINCAPYIKISVSVTETFLGQ